MRQPGTLYAAAENSHALATTRHHGTARNRTRALFCFPLACDCPHSYNGLTASPGVPWGASRCPLVLLDQAARLAPGIDPGALEAKGYERRLAEREECQAVRKAQTRSKYKAFPQCATGRTTRSIARSRGSGFLFHRQRNHPKECFLSTPQPQPNEQKEGPHDTSENLIT